MNKKKTILYFIFTLISFNLFAQNNNVSIKDTIVGKSIYNNIELKGKQIKFNDKIKNISINNTSIEVSTKHSSTTISDSSINNNDKTNQDSSNNNDFIVLCDSIFNVKIIYNGSYFEGIDLINKKSLWTRSIVSNFNISDLIHIDDSNIVVSCNGLHSINILTGKGWDFDLNTIKEDKTSVYVGTTASILFAITSAIAGFNIDDNCFYNEPTLYSYSSNIVYDYPYIFMAGIDRIVCLDVEGNLIWQDSLNKKQTTPSVLFTYDSNIYLINKGFIQKDDDKATTSGKCFINGYNIISGKKIFSSYLKNKDNVLEDYKVVNNDLYMLFDNKLVVFSLANGKTIKEFSHTLESYKDNVGSFAYDNMFFYDKGTFKSINTIDSTNILIFVDDKELNIYNKDMTLIRKVPYDNIFFKTIQANNLTIIGNKKNSLLINEDGIALMKLNISYNAVRIGNKLYDIKDNCITELDLNDLFK